MKLPERLYYPLNKAAKVLNCEVSDLIHLAANGYISLFFKIINNPMSESDWQFALSPNVDEDGLDQYIKDEIGTGLSKVELWHSFSNSYFSYGGKFEMFIRNDVITKYTFTLEHYLGLARIGKTDIYRGEQSLLDEKYINVGWLWTPEDDRSKPIGFFEPVPSDEYNSLPFVLESGEWQGNMLTAIHEESELPRVCINDLLITKTEIEKLKKGTISESTDSDKTIALKGEIIPPLIKMLPSFAGVDLDSFSVAKIKDTVEAIAAEKGIEFPDIHRQTWQKYLGRNRLVK